MPTSPMYHSKAYIHNLGLLGIWLRLASVDGAHPGVWAVTQYSVLKKLLHQEREESLSDPIHEAPVHAAWVAAVGHASPSQGWAYPIEGGLSSKEAPTRQSYLEHTYPAPDRPRLMASGGHHRINYMRQSAASEAIAMSYSSILVHAHTFIFPGNGQKYTYAASCVMGHS
ncbi:hypothetical protein JB92DRAFT_2834604 [Gautieria morchelliformis]|nr:hypothetical protein JB92DRAFT_2834604 [Gautieria morchelliformis]